MKAKYMLLPVLSAFILLPGNGQGFNGGLLVGFTTSQVDGDTWSGYNNFGFQGGTFVNTSFSETWALQLELKYAGKGAANAFNPDNPEILINELHYIEFPALLQSFYQPKLFFEAGIVPAFLVKSLSKDASGILSENAIDYNAFDFSGVLGINYSLNSRLWVNLRFSYSLFPFYKTRAYSNCRPNYASGCFFNNVIGFGLYYQFLA